MEASLHESGDRLELYALGRLSDSEVEHIEEHLFLCDSCRDRLDQTATFALTMRDELKKQPFQTSFLDWLSRPKAGFAVAGAMAMAIAALGISWMGGSAKLAPVASLQLTAMRGELQAAEAAREIDLTLTDAPSAGGPFRVEVVNAAGGAVWTGSPEALGGGLQPALQARIVKSLAPGVYFARLYGSDSRMLHEYGFRVRGPVTAGR